MAPVHRLSCAGLTDAVGTARKSTELGARPENGVGEPFPGQTKDGEGADTIMTLRHIRLAACCTISVLAVVSLSGCLGPTYGTGKTAGEQLVSDLDGMLSLGGPAETEAINYAPRAELVRPTDTSVLPPPREGVNSESDPNWPESPERRRARVQAAADERNETGYMPADFAMEPKEGITGDQIEANSGRRSRGRVVLNDRSSSVLTPQELDSSREAFKAKLRESQQGSPTTRKYLSEPPVAYRQPAATAPVGDPGIDEKVKEAKLNSKSDEGLGSKLRGLLPF